MGAFESSADYYEVLYDNVKRLEREAPLLTSVFKCAPGKRVLDVACGAGLHAEFFAKLGANVRGSDISGQMLEHARVQHSHPNIRYTMGDMRKITGGPWDLIVCLGNSLSLIDGTDELAKTFESVSSSLVSEGLFFFQILNYESESAKKPRHRVERKKTGDREVVAIKDLVPYEDKTLLSLSFFIFEESGSSHVSETTILSNLTLEQIAEVSKGTGMEIVETYGGYNLSAFDSETSSDLICLLRKG